MSQPRSLRLVETPGRVIVGRPSPVPGRVLIDHAPPQTGVSLFFSSNANKIMAVRAAPLGATVLSLLQESDACSSKAVIPRASRGHAMIVPMCWCCATNEEEEQTPTTTTSFTSDVTPRRVRFDIPPAEDERTPRESACVLVACAVCLFVVPILFCVIAIIGLHLYEDHE